MDANKNGKIDFQEFLEKMAERSERQDLSEDLRNVRISSRNLIMQINKQIMRLN